MNTKNDEFLILHYSLVYNFVNGRFLVSGTGYDILVVGRYVAAQHRRRFFRLEKNKKPQTTYKQMLYKNNAEIYSFHVEEIEV